MIEAERANFPVTLMCRVLTVSPSGFHAWASRPPSQRDKKNEELRRQIRFAHLNSRGTYGSPRIHADLINKNIHVSRYRVARLMAQEGLRGRRKGRFIKTTDSNHDRPVAPNLLHQSFDVKGPNQVWVSDICYLRTQQGWLFLCVIIDLYSRRVVGWAMQPALDASLVTRAFQMATLLRSPGPSLIFHSDRGSQYVSDAFLKLLGEARCIQSMSSKGNPFDNAVAETFFATLRVELTYDAHWKTRDAARLDVHYYISSFYNHTRRHSYLGQISPVAFEALHDQDKYGQVA